MVSVWRAVAALSGIFVCVAVGAESIRRSSEAGTANDPHFSSLYQRGAAGNGTRMAVTRSRCWRCGKGRKALRAAIEVQLYKDLPEFFSANAGKHWRNKDLSFYRSGRGRNPW